MMTFLIYNANSQITFKATMLMSSLYNYSDAQIFVKGTIKFANIGTAASLNARNKNEA